MNAAAITASATASSCELARGFTTLIDPGVSALRGLCAFAKNEQCPPYFDPVAAAQRLAARHRTPVDQHLPAPGRTHDEVAPFAPDNRMMGQYGLIAKQADIALFGASDDRDRLGQWIFAAL